MWGGRQTEDKAVCIHDYLGMQQRTHICYSYLKCRPCSRADAPSVTRLLSSFSGPSTVHASTKVHERAPQQCLTAVRLASLRA